MMLEVRSAVTLDGKGQPEGGQVVREGVVPKVRAGDEVMCPIVGEDRQAVLSRADEKCAQYATLTNVAT